MGALRGAPASLVKCETSDILVPASAEIVVEGFVSSDPQTFAMEGPFGEYSGYYGEPRPRPVIRAECITHRNDPVYRGSLEGVAPGAVNEDAAIYTVTSKAAVLHTLERAGVRGVLDARPGPVTIVQVRQSYHGQAKQVAAALWGSAAAEHFWKVIMVVDDDVDIYNDRALHWALCYRVNPATDLLVFPATRGGIDRAGQVRSCRGGSGWSARGRDTGWLGGLRGRRGRDRPAGVGTPDRRRAVHRRDRRRGAGALRGFDLVVRPDRRRADPPARRRDRRGPRPGARGGIRPPGGDGFLVAEGQRGPTTAPPGNRVAAVSQAFLRNRWDAARDGIERPRPVECPRCPDLASSLPASPSSSR